jgi:hypothetical protein
VKIKLLKCCDCNKEKQSNFFYYSKYTENGKNTRCIECMKKNKLIRLTMLSNGIIKCSSCKKEKPIDSFYDDNRAITGKETQCKECVNARNDLYAKNHPNKMREYKRKCRQKYKERDNERRRISKQEHKFKSLASRANERAKKISTGEVITAKQLWSLAKKQKLICAISGLKLTNNNISLDHRISFKNNGKNIIENLQLVTWDINRMKNSHTSEDFLNLIKLIYHHNFIPIAGKCHEKPPDNREQIRESGSQHF